MKDRSRHRGPQRRLEESTDRKVEREASPLARPSRTPSAGRLPAALHGPQYDRVKETWLAARLARDPRLPEFTRALEAHARNARDAGVGVADVLQSLNAVIRPERGGEPALDWDDVREIAGKVVIRAYYRDD